MLTISVYSAILIFFSLLIFWRPSVAIILAFNMFVFEQWAAASSSFFAQHQTLTNIIVGFLIVCSFVMQILKRKIKNRIFSKVTWLIAILFLYSLLSVAWAPDFLKSVHIWRESLPYILTMIFLTSLIIQDDKDLNILFSGILTFGSILAILILFFVQWEGRRIILGYTSFGDPIGGNPLAVGFLGGVLVILSVLYRFKRNHLLLHTLKILAFALGIALLSRSGSRGQLIGAVLILGLLWPLKTTLQEYPTRKIYKSLTMVLFILFLAGLLKFGIDFYWSESNRFNYDVMMTDFSGRFQNALILLENWADSPFSLIFGLGSSSSYSILGIYPHIVPLEILGEEGVIGFSMFCAIIFYVIFSIRNKLILIESDNEKRMIFCCLIAIWLYMLIVMFKQGSLLNSYNFFLFSILIDNYKVKVLQ